MRPTEELLEVKLDEAIAATWLLQIGTTWFHLTAETKKGYVVLASQNIWFLRDKELREERNLTHSRLITYMMTHNCTVKGKKGVL